MNLADFTPPGIVPGIAFGRDCDVTPVKEWANQGLIECPNEMRPDPLMSIWQLTGKGHAKLTGIDKSRHPYKRGVIARQTGKSRDSHELAESVCGTLRHWLAGWDEGGK